MPTGDLSFWMLLAHAVATGVMAGVIWTVQLVHYPLFALVGEEGWCAYERQHMRRITWIVAPAMFAELATSVLILAWRPEGVPAWMAWAGVALVAVNWVSTMSTQGPLHVRLADGFDPRLHDRLVRTNWVRTASWSARAVLAPAMLVAAEFPAGGGSAA